MPRITAERRAARRQQILEAAWECFTRRGFQATTMDEVAAAAGVSAGTTYTYFATKDSMIVATVEIAMGRFAQAFERLADQTEPASPTDVLVAIADELRRRGEHPRYDMTRIGLQAWAESIRSPAVHRAILEGHDRAAGILRGLVERWAATRAEPVNAEQVSELLHTLVPGLMLATVLTGHTPALAIG
ncbi:MAG TPA: TetR/AcrR family transcriptional regulator [Pseudonocardia sp.]|uniref:TetR/AcrR family transcriptional regulator n=1 Tax=Pseudonocardia sp. TaxID=60912 RepID=UPI002B974734|nr:TetR/AcrR family transcriptional regulator [Pseudonocardia sp.]HTF46233.1 TetR/AcrR family transcriptional regulator [Pseudonocardia sp.]